MHLLSLCFTFAQSNRWVPGPRLVLKEQSDAWGPVWFTLNPAVAKELLAVGMTAQISDKMVQAHADPAAPFTTVDFMYLLK